MSGGHLDETGLQKLLEVLKPHIEGSGDGGGVGSVSPITNNLLAAIAKGEYVPAEALGTDLFLNTPGLDTFYRYSLGLEGVPSGCILAYSGEADTVPEGWAVCDGQNGTPDLRGRFILGVSETHPMGETGGVEEVVLTKDQMPSHNHGYYLAEGGRSIVSSSVGHNTGYPYLSNASTLADTSNEGFNKPQTNMPPYYALIYIMKL